MRLLKSVYSKKFLINAVIGCVLIGVGLQFVILPGFWISQIGVIVITAGALFLVWAASFRALHEVERGDTPLSQKFIDIKESVERTVTFLTQDPNTGQMNSLQFEFGKPLDQNQLPQQLRDATDGTVEIHAVVKAPTVDYTAIFYRFGAGTVITDVESTSTANTHVISGSFELTLNPGDSDERTVVLDPGDGIIIPKGTRTTTRFIEDTEIVGIYDSIQLEINS